MKKKYLSILILALGLFASACASASFDLKADMEKENSTEASLSINEAEISDAAVSEPKVTSEPEPEPEPEAVTVNNFIISGDRLTVRGGVYEQDGNTDNGSETIQWIVLEDNGSQMLLISEKVLDCVAYNDSYAGTDWDNSYIRKFLNKSFYDNAFDDTQKSCILDYYTTIEDVSAGIPSVTDKVFLLSYEEVLKYMGENPKGYSETRASVVTKYAQENGVYTLNEKDYGLFKYEEKGVGEAIIGAGNWWLRSTGGKSTEAMDVGASGIIRTTGHDVGSHLDGIRPCILINVSN